jgi:hypothetical protein
MPLALVDVTAKVNVGAIFLLSAFSALAVNKSVLPNCKDALIAGFRVIFAGKGLVPAGLCPPQAGSSEIMRIMTATGTH